MEVNNLTYKVYRYLIRKGWVCVCKPNSKFIFLIPRKQDGLPSGFQLRLPISNKSTDFYSYSANILLLISKIYPKDTKEISRLIELNENLKYRYTKQWIIPENKSRIEKINKFDIYLPH